MLLNKKPQIYVLNLKQNKMRLSHRFRLITFIYFLTRVIFYILNQIYQHYLLITMNFTVLSICINVFIIVIEFFMFA